MPERFRVTVDLGPEIPLAYLAGLLADLQRVCEFGSALDIKSLQNTASSVAARELARNREFLTLDELRRNVSEYNSPESPSVPVPYLYRSLRHALELGYERDTSPQFHEAEASFLLRQSREDTTPRVEYLRYSNPADIWISIGSVLTAAGGLGASIRWLLPIIRDWGPQRDQLRANAEKTRAEAEKTNAEAEAITSQAWCREQIIVESLEQVRRGRLNVSAAQLDATLTDETTGAVLRLASAAPEIEFLDDDNQSA